jgi:hypothetical protein
MLSKIGLVVVTLTVVGCVTEELDTSEASQQIGKGVGTCPDPFDCTLSNGGGVYTEELGNIGLGTDNYMIGRFVNVNGGVQIQGRGYNPATGNYYGHSAELARAIYNGRYLQRPVILGRLDHRVADASDRDAPIVIDDARPHRPTGRWIGARVQGRRRYVDAQIHRVSR